MTDSAEAADRLSRRRVRVLQAVMVLFAVHAGLFAATFRFIRLDRAALA